MLALDRLCLEVERGEIFGYLGPNGAGKTTTIRLLLGFLRPSHGSASLFGLDCVAQSVAVRRRIGYLPGDVRLYDALSGRELLALFLRLRGRDPGTAPLDELAERFALDLSRRIKTYSKGMKQKLGLLQALAHDPELLVLDEPTSALDPLMQEELYEVLRERRRRGTTIFFSSHILSEVEKLCDRVGIVRGGRLLALEGVEEVRRLDLRRVRFATSELEPAREALVQAGLEVEERDGELELTVRGEMDRVVKLLARFEISTLTVEPMSLEDVFFELYRDPEA